MKKSILLLASAFLCTSAFAENYFITPAGCGAGDGSSWEDAAAGADINDILSGLEPGDNVYFMAGTYGGASTDIVPGLTVIGGFPTTAKGADISGYDPVANLTLFDCEGKNVNAAKAYVRVVAGDDQKELVTTIKGITISGAKSILSADGSNSRSNPHIVGSAFYCSNAKVILEDVVFKGNTSAVGGVVVAGENSKFLAKHCKWIDNVNDYWTQFPEAGPGFTAVCFTALPSIVINPGRTTSILDGCVFTGNKIDGDSKNKSKWGGLINIVDRTNNKDYSAMSYSDLIAVNNIFDGGELEIFQKGACLRQGMRSYILLAYNTFYGFRASDPALGTTISFHGDNVLTYMGCNIVVDNSATIDNNYAIGLDNNLRSSSDTFAYTSTSFGYNTVSGTTPNKKPESFFAVATDQWNVVDGEATVFGGNKLTAKGNTMVIEPVKAYADVKMAEVNDAFKATNFPNDFLEVFGDKYNVDLTVDITGAKRSATTYRGAYDPSAQGAGSGIGEIASSSEELSIVRIAKDIYRLNGGSAKVYNVAGQVVCTDANGIIDLTTVSTGIYIISSNGKSHKVVK